MILKIEGYSPERLQELLEDAVAADQSKIAADTSNLKSLLWRLASCIRVGHEHKVPALHDAAEAFFKAAMSQFSASTFPTDGREHRFASRLEELVVNVTAEIAAEIT